MVEIITAMREKVVQAANDALGPAEKASIQVELAQRSAEFNDLVDETTFNDRKLLDGTYINQSYQIGENVTDVLLVSLTQDHTAAGLKIDPANVADLVSTAAGAHQALDNLDAAHDAALATLSQIGSLILRLDFQGGTLTTAITNHFSVTSRLEDADIAREQLESVKAQILQQTNGTALALANLRPQSVLALFQ